MYVGGGGEERGRQFAVNGEAVMWCLQNDG